MPGAKAKKRCKHTNGADRDNRELYLCEDGQMYATVQKACGGGRFVLACGDGVERLGKLRGSMRKSEWVSGGDIVLASARSFDDGKCDILHRYTQLEVSRLRRYGELECFDAPVSATETDIEFIDFV